MSPWLVHVVLGSIGLLCAGVLGQICLWLWRKRPLASYRLVCALLFGALLLPVAQVGMQRWQAPQELELVRRLAPVFAAREAGPATEAAPDPLAAGLTVAELEALMSVLAEEPRSPAPARAAPAETAATRIPLLELLAGVYLAGLAFALVRLARRLIRTRGFLRDTRPVTEPRVRAVWRELVEESPQRARIELLASPRVQAPVCFGLRRPVIVVPATLEDASFARGPEVLRCVLQHELVHLERRDTWVMLVQEIFHGLFWFHPAAWWLCRKLDALRELSCDLLVVRRTGRRKRYAQALLEYADLLAHPRPSPSSTALLPWSGTKSQLSRRIEMLVSLPSQRSFPWTTVPAAVSLVSCLWTGQLAVAAALSPQDAEPFPPAAAPTLPQEPAWPLPAAEPTPALLPPAAAEPHPAWLPGPAVLPQPAPRAEPVPLIGSLPPFAEPTLPTQDPFAQVQADRQDKRLIGVYLGDDSPSGIRVNQVMKGSVAERHELRAGDVILEINGEPATRAGLERGKRTLPGGTMTLGIARGERYLRIVLHGDDWPQPRRAESPMELGGLGAASRYRQDASQEQIDRAHAALLRAIELNPDDEAVRRALTALQAAQNARARANTSREQKERQLQAAKNAQARGDYEMALRSLQWLESQKKSRTQRDPVKRYEEVESDYWRQIERQQADKETDRRASIEDRLRATENELEKRTRELEELKARINALEARRGARGARGGGGASGVRSGGQRPRGTSSGGGGTFGGVRQRTTGQTEPTRPVGEDIAGELADVRKQKDGTR